MKDDGQYRTADVSAIKKEILKAVRARYFSSADFNGFYISTDISRTIVDAAVGLVRDGLLQVVSSQDYPNPHIRPWSSRRTVEQQVGSLEGLSDKEYGVCLYPTELGMKGVRLPKRFAGRPYDQAVLRGRGVLELAYFDFGVLEPYRNDPRYRFSYDDFGAYMSVSDEVYLDESEPERDKVSLSHIGFAYDLSKYERDDPESPMVRRVAAFYGDLSRLTPEHQQRWKSYQVPDSDLEPHPVWFGTQMGHWPDGSGPFDRLIAGMENINHLWTNAFGAALFRTTERPRELGWLLRPSQRDWDEFIHQLDKLLSENLDAKALDAAGAPKKNASGDTIGSLNRMNEFMLAHGVKPDIAREVMRPIRQVREARQGPAHSLRANVTDQTYIHKQVVLLGDVNESLFKISDWLATHPGNHNVTLPHSDKDLGLNYRM